MALPESQEKHPSALEYFEAVLAAAKGKQIVMFLDYDGTLSPIVEDPDSAVMTEEVRSTTRPSAPLFHRSFRVFDLLCSDFTAVQFIFQMRDAVRGVAQHFPTAIVSGRCRDKVHSSANNKSHFLLPGSSRCRCWFYYIYFCCFLGAIYFSFSSSGDPCHAGHHHALVQ